MGASEPPPPPPPPPLLPLLPPPPPPPPPLEPPESTRAASVVGVGRAADAGIVVGRRGGLGGLLRGAGCGGAGRGGGALGRLARGDDLADVALHGREPILAGPDAARDGRLAGGAVGERGLARLALLRERGGATLELLLQRQHLAHQTRRAAGRALDDVDALEHVGHRAGAEQHADRVGIARPVVGDELLRELGLRDAEVAARDVELLRVVADRRLGAVQPGLRAVVGLDRLRQVGVHLLELRLHSIGFGLTVGQPVRVRASTEERKQDEQRYPPEESSAGS